MERKTGKRGQLMGGLFTMLLFLVFILSALFTVLTGSRVYDNITARSDKNFSSSTALSYIANKVRQGVRAGMTVLHIPKFPDHPPVQGRCRYQ